MNDLKPWQKCQIEMLWGENIPIRDIATSAETTGVAVKNYLSNIGWTKRPHRQPSLPKVKFLTMPDPLRGTGV